ncbi:MAG: helix-turn-helix transcriptional regulator [Erysipelotrichales bacterium]|nr:helix-turn-helix transcriptional regulator [Erysipelotrichales bacterium]
MNLSQFIRSYRKANKLTMQELADKSGLSKGYISMLENDNNYRAKKKTIPSIDVLKKLSKAMNISFDEIMNAVDDEVSLTGEDIIVDNPPRYSEIRFALQGKLDQLTDEELEEMNVLADMALKRRKQDK